MAELDEEAEEEYEVEKIIDRRIRGGAPDYKVLWKGYDKSEAT